MATEVIHTIGAGEPYTTIAAWESAQQRNLVTADEIAVAELKSQTFSEDVAFNGWTTDTTRYILVRAASGAKYEHVADTGAKLVAPNNNGHDVYVDVHFEDILIGSLLYYQPIYIRTGGYATVSRCTVLFSTVLFNSSTNSQKYESCILKSTTSYGALQVRSQSFYNCTVIATNPYGQVLRDAIAYNTVVYNTTTPASYGNFFGGTGDYNSSTDASATGANSVDSITSSVFNAYGSDDYTLSGTGSALYHLGTNTQAPTLDHDGVAFDVTTPSIGAFEFVAAGSGFQAAWARNTNTLIGGLNV